MKKNELNLNSQAALTRRLPNSEAYTLSRRAALKAALAAGSFALLDPGEWLQAAGVASTGVPDLNFPKLGKLKPRAASAIAASPLSVGFETLDRRMFEPAKCYPHLAALGAKWARCQTGWARTETVKGQFDFSWLDAVVDSLLKIGMQPWFNVGYGNRLYMPEAPDASAVGWAPVHSSAALEAWQRYVERLAQHFAGRVRHWEIWNEPNITNFWKPEKPDAAKYVELVRATAPIIRRRVPQAQIIGGAFAGMPRPYFESVLAAGLGELVDTISFHPYRPIPESKYAEDVQAFRDLMAKHNATLTLWQGENGCPSQPGSAGALRQYDWDELQQAKWVLRRILSDLRLRLELTSYFHTVDLVDYNWGSGPSGQTNFKGLLRGREYSPKPSYHAYQNLCAMFDAATVAAEPPAGFPSEWPLLSAHFTRQGQPLHVFWRATDLHKPFESASFPGELRLPKQTGGAVPVLIDPLTGSVYKVACQEERGEWRITEALPVLDYPLIVTTARAVEIEPRAAG